MNLTDLKTKPTTELLSIAESMGLESLGNWNKRVGFFVGAIDRFDEIKPGDEAYVAKQFMKTMRIDRVAARLLLTEGVDDPPADALDRLTLPTLVVAGNRDRDNGSPEALAQALPDARLRDRVPGKRYDFYHLLHGLAQHELYHAGQIAILKKAALSARVVR